MGALFFIPHGGLWSAYVSLFFVLSVVYGKGGGQQSLYFLTSIFPAELPHSLCDPLQNREYNTLKSLVVAVIPSSFYVATNSMASVRSFEQRE